MEEHGAESPDAAEDEVDLVPLLGALRGQVLVGEEAVQQVAQHLDVRDLGHGRDLLELGAQRLEGGRHVLVEQDQQVGLLRGLVPLVDPRRHVPMEPGAEPVVSGANLRKQISLDQDSSFRKHERRIMK